jgi:hypothetical protein
MQRLHFDNSLISLQIFDYLDSFDFVVMVNVAVVVGYLLGLDSIVVQMLYDYFPVGSPKFNKYFECM